MNALDIPEPEITDELAAYSSAENAKSENDQSLLYLRAIMATPGLGCASLARLLRAFDSPKLIWEAEPSSLMGHLSEAKRLALLQQREQPLPIASTDHWLADCRQRGVEPLSLNSLAYPAALREIAQPPPILYVRGDVSALAVERTLAIVGTRNATPYGGRATQSLVAQMAQLAPGGFSIISGLAAGIDTEAHKAALYWGLPTVAVFGCGLDIIFPAKNAKLADDIVERGGALISEYEFGVRPSRTTFPRRNRIVAGLSQGIAVIEGDQRSGAMITAKLALEEGRTVFALPGAIFEPGSQGPLSLLKSGAVPITSGEDILLDLRWLDAQAGVKARTESYRSLPKIAGKSVSGMPFSAVVTNPDEGAMIDNASCKKALTANQAPLRLPVPDSVSPLERLLLERLTFEPHAIEALQQDLGWSSPKIGEVLTLLELEGLIQQLPGARVCRTLL
jgi:DNA processing protein